MSEEWEARSQPQAVSVTTRSETGGSGMAASRDHKLFMDCSRARTKNPSEWLDLCPDFSKPMAERLTDWILTWEPDLRESIKWNMLAFTGRKLVCSLSACQKHLGVAFFRGTELPDPAKLFNEGGENNTNIRSVRITSLDTLDRAALRVLLGPIFGGGRRR